MGSHYNRVPMTEDKILAIVRAGIPVPSDDTRPVLHARTNDSRQVAAATETDLISIADGAGVIRSIQIIAEETLNTTNCAKFLDSVLKVYPDGAVTPTLTATLAELVLQPRPANRMIYKDSCYDLPNGLRCHTWRVVTYGKHDIVIPWGIPFSDGIRVSLTTTLADPIGVYVNAPYHSGAHPWSLGRYGVLRAARFDDTVVGDTIATLADITGKGVVIACAAHQIGATSSQYLEADWSYEVDGTETFRSTGTEDYFGGAFYYGQLQFFGALTGCLEVAIPDAYTHAAYRIHSEAPILFDESLVLKLDNRNEGTYIPSDVAVKSVLLYYTED